jgi:hypothetical protein
MLVFVLRFFFLEGEVNKMVGDPTWIRARKIAIVIKLSFYQVNRSRRQAMQHPHGCTYGNPYALGLAVVKPQHTYGTLAKVFIKTLNYVVAVVMNNGTFQLTLQDCLLFFHDGWI